MNSVQLLGRLTKDVDLRYASNQDNTAVARFGLAVDRRFKKEGAQNVDFINCVAFGKTAEFCQKYFCKGSKMAVTGRIQSGSYKRQDGTTVYTTDVAVDGVYFCESAKAGSEATNNAAPSPVPDAEGFLNIPEGFDEELPFD